MFLRWAVLCCCLWGQLSRAQQSPYLSQPRQYSPYLVRERPATGYQGLPFVRDTGVAESQDSGRSYNRGAFGSGRIQTYRQPYFYNALQGRDLTVQGSTRTGSRDQQLVPVVASGQPPPPAPTAAPQVIAIPQGSPNRVYVDDEDRLIWENPPPEIPVYAFALERTHPSKLESEERSVPAQPTPIPAPVVAAQPSLPVAETPAQALRYDSQSVPLRAPESIPIQSLQPRRPFRLPVALPPTLETPQPTPLAPAVAPAAPQPPTVDSLRVPQPQVPSYISQPQRGLPSPPPTASAPLQQPTFYVPPSPPRPEAQPVPQHSVEPPTAPPPPPPTVREPVVPVEDISEVRSGEGGFPLPSPMIGPAPEEEQVGAGTLPLQPPPSASALSDVSATSRERSRYTYPMLPLPVSRQAEQTDSQTFQAGPLSPYASPDPPTEFSPPLPSPNSARDSGAIEESRVPESFEQGSYGLRESEAQGRDTTPTALEIHETTVPNPPSTYSGIPSTGSIAPSVVPNPTSSYNPETATSEGSFGLRISGMQLNAQSTNRREQEPQAELPPAPLTAPPLTVSQSGSAPSESLETQPISSVPFEYDTTLTSFQERPTFPSPTASSPLEASVTGTFQDSSAQPSYFETSRPRPIAAPTPETVLRESQTDYIPPAAQSTSEPFSSVSFGDLLRERPPISSIPDSGAHPSAAPQLPDPNVHVTAEAVSPVPPTPSPLPQHLNSGHHTSITREQPSLPPVSPTTYTLPAISELSRPSSNFLRQRQPNPISTQDAPASGIQAVPASRAFAHGPYPSRTSTVQEVPGNSLVSSPQQSLLPSPMQQNRRPYVQQDLPRTDDRNSVTESPVPSAIPDLNRGYIEQPGAGVSTPPPEYQGQTTPQDPGVTAPPGADFAALLQRAVLQRASGQPLSPRISEFLRAVESTPTTPAPQVANSQTRLPGSFVAYQAPAGTQPQQVPRTAVPPAAPQQIAPTSGTSVVQQPQRPRTPPPPGAVYVNNAQLSAPHQHSSVLNGGASRSFYQQPYRFPYGFQG